MISTRRLVALRGLVLGIAACSSPAPRVGVVAVVPPRPGTPIPSAVEFRVPKAPTVANSDSGTFVGYELHVTNLTPGAMSLRRVEVLDDD